MFVINDLLSLTTFYFFIQNNDCEMANNFNCGTGSKKEDKMCSMHSRKVSKMHKKKVGIVEHLRNYSKQDAYHHVCFEYFKNAA